MSSQPLFLDQTEARRANKKFFEDQAPVLSQGLDDCPPPLSKGLDPPLIKHLGALLPAATP